MKKKIIISIFAVVALLSAIIIPGINNNPEISEYDLISPLISENIRLCLVTDFHSSGNGSKIIQMIEKAEPEVILLGGDIFDDENPDQNTIELLGDLSSRFPCFFVTGNHEYWRGEEQYSEAIKIIEEFGITRLSGEIKQIKLKGQIINLCGVDDPANQLYEIINNPEKEFEHQLDKLSSETDGKYLTILLTHRPEYADKYINKGFDLILAGHAHGGQIRIPVMHKGIYSPGQGLFPKYTSGVYELNGTTMIVSRGLTVGKEIIPRLYNRPEICIINIHPSQASSRIQPGRPDN